MSKRNKKALSKKRDAEKTKNRILNASLNIFAKKGYDVATTREICEKAGININLIYYYFGGKKELYNAVIFSLFEKQTKFMSSHLNLAADLTKLSISQKFELLHVFAKTIVDFFYNIISIEELQLFHYIQLNKEGPPAYPPAYQFALKLFAGIYKKMNHDEVVLELLFFSSQIIFPKVVPSFSLKTMGKKEFSKKDVQLVHEHMKNYIDAMVYTKAMKKRH